MLLWMLLCVAVNDVVRVAVAFAVTQTLRG